MSIGKDAIIFSIGAAVGAVTTWLAVRKYYNDISEEEIASVKEHYNTRKVYEDIASGYAGGYEDQDVVTQEVPEPEEEERISQDRPYVISPEEFDNISGYETVSLTYYADKILADDDDNIIEEDDIEEIIGKESLTHFGEYEDDSVFVRNDSRRCDYEILLDIQKYSDVIKKNKPWLFKDRKEERSDE